MRDKWCKSRPVDKCALEGALLLDVGRRDSGNIAAAGGVPAFAFQTSNNHDTKVANAVNDTNRFRAHAQDGLMSTEQRMAYDTLRSQFQTNTNSIAPAQKHMILSTTDITTRSDVDLNEIRAYRNTNPSKCRSSQSIIRGIAQASTSRIPPHRCQVRYRLNRRQETVPCAVNAAGQPLCEICGQAFDRNTTTPLQYAGSSHLLRVLKSGSSNSSRNTSISNHTTNEQLHEKPSLILEIHDYGQSRDLELSNRERRLLDIRITNKLTPPNSLALRHQRQH